MPAQPPPPTHFDAIKDAASRGALTLFYGAGINYPQRPNNRKFDATALYCPTGAELALYLAEKYDYPELAPFQKIRTTHQDALTEPGSTHGKCAFADAALPLLEAARTPALALAAQYPQTMESSLGYNLALDLHQLFDRTFPSTPMHDVLARLPGLSVCDRRPVFITTNYDTVLERALAQRGEPFDVLFYRAPGAGTPVWLYHWKNAHLYYHPTNPAAVPAGWDNPVGDLADYRDLPVGDGQPLAMPNQPPRPLTARTMVVKIHGTVAPTGYEASSFVISQSDYVGFLRQVSTKNPLPSSLLKPLQESHFLFLGYGLGDWNIMALCQNLWNNRRLKNYKNWAVQYRPSAHDCEYWALESAGRVNVFDQDITAYAQTMAGALFPPPPP